MPEWIEQGTYWRHQQKMEAGTFAGLVAEGLKCPPIWIGVLVTCAQSLSAGFGIEARAPPQEQGCLHQHVRVHPPQKIQRQTTRWMKMLLQMGWAKQVGPKPPCECLL